MNVLLDTCALLWVAEADAKLSRPARDAIDRAERRFVSHASVWEFVIKLRIGALTINHDFVDFVSKQIPDAGFDYLPILLTHFVSLHGLPLHGKHRDPFDRLLIAQALTEKLPIISSDEQFDQYGVQRIW